MLFRPLLAATCDDSNIHKLQYPLLASPKLDGIRVLVKDNVAQTRSLKPVRNKFVSQHLSSSLLNGLDGEICAGDVLDPKCFRNTTTAVMAEDAVIGFTYWVFDDFLNPNVFGVRYEALQERIGNNVLVKRLEHHLIHNRTELEEYESWCLNAGFEGTMLRDPNGRYKYNRSTFNEGILLKLKRGHWITGEGKILGFIERMENRNEAFIDERGFTKRSVHKENKVGRNQVGTILIEDPEFPGEEIKVGNGDGLDDALRTDMWNNPDKFLKQTLRYKWFKYGGYNKPRHAQYICIRHPDDMSEG